MSEGNKCRAEFWGIVTIILSITKYPYWELIRNEFGKIRAERVTRGYQILEQRITIARNEYNAPLN